MIYLFFTATLIINAVIAYMMMSQKTKEIDGKLMPELYNLGKRTAEIRRDVSEIKSLSDKKIKDKESYTLVVESRDGNKYRFENVIKFVDGSDVTYAAYGLYEHGNEDTLKVFTDDTDEPHAIVNRADIRAVYKEDVR